MLPEVDPSAAPRREPGLRSRAGNAMLRTRSAVLDGAVRAVEKHGARRTTMSDVATLAGVAKGTLYNHFRTKDAVFAAALEAGVDSLAAECVTVAADDLGEALGLAADRLANHTALRRLALEEPAALAQLTAIGGTPAWAAARAAVAEVLAAAGRDTSPAAVDVVLRWLVSFAGQPGDAVEQQAAMVASALPRAAAPRVVEAQLPLVN
jgi:AcrR family transcriptional regulator